MDLGRVTIPSPPKSPGDDNLASKKVWIKLNIREGEGRQWVQFYGAIIGVSAGRVRGGHRWMVHIETLGQNFDVDPEILEQDGGDGGAYIARVLKEIPAEAASLGRDMHCYIVEDEHNERLRAWDGRYVGSGRRIGASVLSELKKDLGSYVRRHAQCYVKGEEWPTYPAEADLGLDRRTKEKASEEPATGSAARRSRSRSHSLGRVMRDLEETEVTENDQQEIEGMIETYEVARGSGQSVEDSAATVAVVYEIRLMRASLQRDSRATPRTTLRRGATHAWAHALRCCSTSAGDQRLEKGQSASARLLVRRTLSQLRVPNQPHAWLLRHPRDSVDAQTHQDPRSDPLKEKGPGIHSWRPMVWSTMQLFGGSEAARMTETRTVEDLFGDSTIRAGAGPTDDPEVAARMVHVLEGIRKATEGEKKNSPGTRSALGSEEALDMYLARGCNTLKVEVLPDSTGKELFDGLKRACGHSKALLQGIGWPCLITNGIAYGLASMSHGGRDHTTLPNWSLSVAQAVTAKPRDFDNYEMPKDDKVEPKPRHPTHFATWLRQAKNEIAMLGSVMGLEHKVDRLRALDQLEKAHDADPEAWPESYCFSLWEELKAAWVEELREERRKLCKLLNTDQPRKEDLKFVALAPNSGFRFPNTFRLDEPNSYYQTVCVPRQSRAIKSIIYAQLHHKKHAPKVGEVEEDQTEDGGDTSRLGKVRPKKGGDKGDKPPVKAYPAGKRLRAKEASESVKHAPKTKEGKPICWDAACHSGCQRNACSHAHVPVNATKGLHWTVLAQFIRRGGLKNGPLIQAGQVDGRVAQLRAQAKQEQAEKIQDGGKQGWLPPEGYEVPDEYGDTQYTALEEDLRELTRGPDHSWLEDRHEGKRRVWSTPTEHPEAKRRTAKLEELEEAGAFAEIKEMSNHLQTHIRGRILNEALEGKEMKIEEVLLEATEQGAREIAEEARSALEKSGHQVGREDRTHAAWIGGPTWCAEGGYGTPDLPIDPCFIRP